MSGVFICLASLCDGVSKSSVQKAVTLAQHSLYLFLQVADNWHYNVIQSLAWKTLAHSDANPPQTQLLTIPKTSHGRTVFEMINEKETSLFNTCKINKNLHYRSQASRNHSCGLIAFAPADNVKTSNVRIRDRKESLAAIQQLLMQQQCLIQTVSCQSMHFIAFVLSDK